jgi:hypothetical protein
MSEFEFVNIFDVYNINVQDHRRSGASLCRSPLRTR